MSMLRLQEYYANTGALKRAAESARGDGGKVGVSIVEAFGKQVPRSAGNRRHAQTLGARTWRAAHCRASRVVRRVLTVLAHAINSPRLRRACPSIHTGAAQGAGGGAAARVPVKAAQP